MRLDAVSFVHVEYAINAPAHVVPLTRMEPAEIRLDGGLHPERIADALSNNTLQKGIQFPESRLIQGPEECSIRRRCFIPAKDMRLLTADFLHGAVVYKAN